MILLVVIQLIHDVLFYVGVIKPITLGHNQMIDVFKKYGEDLGAKVLGGDALLMIFSALFAMIYKSISSDKFYSINALVVYALPYILFTRNPYEVLTTETKKEK